MAIKKYGFHGSILTGGSSQLLSGSVATVRQEIQLDSFTRSGDEPSTIELDDNDLIEVELDHVTLLLTVEELNQYSLTAASRDSSINMLPTTMAGEQTTRGLVSVAIRALRVIGINVVGKAIEIAAERVEGWLDERGPGIYKISEQGEFSPQSLPAGEKPVLLLIHGTASASKKAFAGILPDPDELKDGSNPDPSLGIWNQIYREFDGQVYALEHKTLTETPVQNIIDFLQSWPSSGGSPLVLLSHSRGGIVGDHLSCLMDWESQPAELIDSLAPNTLEKRSLVALKRAVSQTPVSARPKVLRHIRVGSPAAGTSLASSKTHIWLSVLSSISQKIPVVGLGVSAVADLAAAIVKEGLEPGVLPGIEAQQNDSPFISTAQYYKTHQTDLYAITAESRGLVKQTLDLIFPGSHDLVVDTESMIQGPLYRSKVALTISDDDITHVNYFQNRCVRRELLSALKGERNDQFKLISTEARSRGRISQPPVDANAEKPCIILLPGIMGSELSEATASDTCDVWLDAFQLLLGRGKKLRINNESIKATGVLELGYEGFARFANESADTHLIPFGYDWRRSIAEAAIELDELIKNRQSVSDMPIMLVCHSMGGLVAREWRRKFHQDWKDLVEAGGRMVQLGTPNYGSWSIARIFQGKEKIVSRLALADLRNSEKDWLNWISRFPGLLELSYFDNQQVDLADPDVWEDLGVKVRIPVALLRSAAQFCESLKHDHFETDKDILYVAGHSELTPTLDIIDSHPTVIDAPHVGDGRVLWPSDNQKQVDYFIPVAHGNMLNQQNYFEPILELALTGETTGLQKTIPSFEQSPKLRARVRRLRAGLPSEAPLFSSNEALAASALGAVLEHVSPEKTIKERLRVAITHGNLLFRKNPILVGHYVGDPIQRAEWALDNSLGGLLTRRWKLGAEFYAGEVGTHEIAIRQASHQSGDGPQGAIVVGLGRMGELQKGGLILTVRNAVLEYLQIQAERPLDSSELHLTSLLIGSGQEALQLQDVLDGVLQGVIAANQIMERGTSPGAKPIKIAEVEFIDWYLDVAIEARHTIERVVKTLPVEIEILEGVRATDGGRARVSAQENADWWTSIQIELEHPPTEENHTHHLSTMKFSVLGGHALGLVDSVHFNKRDIDKSLEPLLSTSSVPKPEEVIALFEQLIPPGLKPFVAQRRNLVINIDPKVAYLPWEVLVDRKSGGIQEMPLSVAAGMLRRIIPDQDSTNISHALYAEEKKALLIGNPPGGPRFQNLKGAFLEARQVYSLLKEKGWKVNDDYVFDDDKLVLNAAARIRTEILANDYQILHFAAHGVFNGNSPGESGVVLGYDPETQQEELFSPHHIKAIRHKPSVVFINCCHTGKIGNWISHKLSASLAAEFMKVGVHCVIGAGWAVDDNASKLFAQVIYENMLDGYSFGFAVREARKMVFNQYPNTNTWAAFQCYGNYGFTLSKQAHSTSKLSKFNYCHINEALCDLQNLRSALKESRNNNRDAITRKAGNIYEFATKQRDVNSNHLWSEDGELLVLMAAIYCEADAEAKAEEFLDLVSKANKSNVKVADLLAIENYKARLVERQFHREMQISDNKVTSDVRRRYEALLTDVIEQLQLYASVHHDANTLNMLASAYKLSAMISTRNARKSKLERMIDLYAQAAKNGGNGAYYPGTNALLGIALLEDSKEQQSYAESGLVEELKAITQNSLQKLQARDFWEHIAHWDFQIVESLMLNNLTVASAAEAAEKIRELSIGSKAEIDSVHKQFRFIALVSEDETTQLAAQKIVEILSSAAGGSKA